MCRGRARGPSAPTCSRTRARGWAAHAALSVVTVFLRLAWRTVADIVAQVVADGRNTNDVLAGLVRIGIDEIAYARGTGI